MLIPSNITFVRETMLATFDVDALDQYGTNNDYFTSYLTLGDNFVVNVEEMNIEGVDFYILMCTKIIYTL